LLFNVLSSVAAGRFPAPGDRNDIFQRFPDPVYRDHWIVAPNHWQPSTAIAYDSLPSGGAMKTGRNSAEDE
jgi:hypothetical protein